MLPAPTRHALAASVPACERRQRRAERASLRALVHAPGESVAISTAALEPALLSSPPAHRLTRQARPRAPVSAGDPWDQRREGAAWEACERPGSWWRLRIPGRNAQAPAGAAASLHGQTTSAVFAGLRALRPPKQLSGRDHGTCRRRHLRPKLPLCSRADTLVPTGFETRSGNDPSHRHAERRRKRREKRAVPTRRRAQPDSARRPNTPWSRA
jgi:hypothetical protein